MKKEKLIFIPGTLCDKRLWQHQISHLSDKVEIMVADISKEDSIEKIASSILKNVEGEFSLAGLSMGGMVSLEIMRQGSERVRRLALLDTNPYPPTKEQIKNFQLYREMCMAGKFENVFHSYILPSLVHPKRQEDANLMSLIIAMAHQIGTNGYINQLTALINRKGSLDILNKISCPTLLLTGENDVLCPVKLHQEMANRIENANLVVLKNCGHLSSLEQGNAVTFHLSKWLSK